MKISLILATVDRTEQVERFLTSLRAQRYAPLQLVVVDQNLDDRVTRLLAGWERELELVYLRSSPGLSRARNVGLRHADGDIVCFPDDDCEYGPGTLAAVAAHFTRDPALEGLTGRSQDEHGRTTGGVFATTSGPVGLRDVWVKGTSYTIFLRKKVCDAIGHFDESLGLGAGTPFGAAEDTDYLIRAIKNNTRLFYFHDLTVKHPDKGSPIDAVVYRRAVSYGAGMGRVLVKHDYPLPQRANWLLRPLVGAAVAALQLKPALTRMRLHTAKGRLQGLLARFER